MEKGILGFICSEFYRNVSCSFKKLIVHNLLWDENFGMISGEWRIGVREMQILDQI